MSVIKRGNQWCLRHRVPVEFQVVESHSDVWISLKTDSRRLACEKAPAAWTEQVAAGKARLSGHHGEAVRSFEDVQGWAAAILNRKKYFPQLMNQRAQLNLSGRSPTCRIFQRHGFYVTFKAKNHVVIR